uniref:Pyridoxamine 5'-phosphate oxidase family protein n=1 Tax=Panagrellus redivivus TaxID=6233 RepID=A0A7E5A154_PANRE
MAPMSGDPFNGYPRVTRVFVFTISGRCAWFVVSEKGFNDGHTTNPSAGTHRRMRNLAVFAQVSVDKTLTDLSLRQESLRLSRTKHSKCEFLEEQDLRVWPPVDMSCIDFSTAHLLAASV